MGCDIGTKKLMPAQRARSTMATEFNSTIGAEKMVRVKTNDRKVLKANTTDVSVIRIGIRTCITVKTSR
jgi:hypothetical protein